jgi:hypothetical protein
MKEKCEIKEEGCGYFVLLSEVRFLSRREMLHFFWLLKYTIIQRLIGEINCMRREEIYEITRGSVA